MATWRPCSGMPLRPLSDMEGRARSARKRVAEVLNVARDLEDALREASGTPVIGDTIGEAAGTAGVFATALSDVADLLQDYVDTLASLTSRFEDPIDAADSAHQGYVTRWLQEPYDKTWRSVARRQPITRSHAGASSYARCLLLDFPLPHRQPPSRLGPETHRSGFSGIPQYSTSKSVRVSRSPSACTMFRKLAKTAAYRCRSRR